MRAGKLDVFSSHALVPLPDSPSFGFIYKFTGDGKVYMKTSDGISTLVGGGGFSETHPIFITYNPTEGGGLKSSFIVFDYSQLIDRIAAIQLFSAEMKQLILPESNNKLTQIVLTELFFTDATVIDCLKLQNLYSIHVQYCSNLTIQNLGSLPNTLEIRIEESGLTSIPSLSNNVSLQSLTARSPILTTVGSLLGTYLNSVVVENSAINASSMSQMLVDLDTNGQSGGTILATGGTNAGVAALTVAGAAAKTSLEGKGWSVLLNP